jgi:hypothetical protein
MSIEGLMTSKFLLHLSSDSIDLERMDASGHWHRLGSVSPDIENLSEALANLRQTAVPDAAGPLEVLVALPADQIKGLDIDHTDTSSAALQQALAGQTPYEFSELCVDCHPTAQGQTIAAIAQETLEEAEDLTEAFGFKAVGFVALPGAAWENNFAVFDRSGSRTQNRPSAYIVATQETKAADVTPLAALAQSAVPTPKLSARAADQAAPTPKISVNPTAEIDMAPPPPNVRSAPAAAPARQVTYSTAVPLETAPTANPKPQARHPMKIMQRLAKIRTGLRQRPRKPTPAHITTIQAQVGGKPKYLGLILTTLLVLFMFTVATLAATLGRDKISAWLGLSGSQTEMTASMPADTIGQAIEISLQPLSGPSAPAKQAARVPQAQDEALQLQKAEVALKDPENDAEPAMSLAAQEPPAVRALAIGPVTEPVTTPAPEEKSLISARDPNLQKDGVPPPLDTPWLTPDPLPDKVDPTPEVAEDQAEDPSTTIQTALAEAANTPLEAAAPEQIDLPKAPLSPNSASPVETDPLAEFRPKLRPARLPAPVRPQTLPEGQSIARTLRPQLRPRAIELAALLPAPVVAKPSEIQAPTATSRKAVTRAATRTNVINLRNINLIGITGTSRLRNALVRLPNGQVVKVRIGDRLDGGRVTDISTKSLTYAKSGRSITLDMPRG